MSTQSRHSRAKASFQGEDGGSPDRRRRASLPNTRMRSFPAGSVVAAKEGRAESPPRPKPRSANQQHSHVRYSQVSVSSRHSQDNGYTSGGGLASALDTDDETIITQRYRMMKRQTRKTQRARRSFFAQHPLAVLTRDQDFSVYAKAAAQVHNASMYPSSIEDVGNEDDSDVWDDDDDDDNDDFSEREASKEQCDTTDDPGERSEEREHPSLEAESTTDDARTSSDGGGLTPRESDISCSDPGSSCLSSEEDIARKLEKIAPKSPSQAMEQKQESLCTTAVYTSPCLPPHPVPPLTPVHATEHLPIPPVAEPVTKEAPPSVAATSVPSAATIDTPSLPLPIPPAPAPASVLASAPPLSLSPASAPAVPPAPASAPCMSPPPPLSLPPPPIPPPTPRAIEPAVVQAIAERTAAASQDEAKQIQLSSRPQPLPPVRAFHFDRKLIVEPAERTPFKLQDSIFHADTFGTGRGRPLSPRLSKLSAARNLSSHHFPTTHEVLPPPTPPRRMKPALPPRPPLPPKLRLKQPPPVPPRETTTQRPVSTPSSTSVVQKLKLFLSGYGGS